VSTTGGEGGERPPRHWILRLREQLAARPSTPPVCDLGVGQPDGAPPSCVREVLARPPVEHSPYPDPIGAPSLRAAAAAWLSARYGLELEASEVLVVHGTRLPIALAPLAFTAPGDVVVCPTPGYPTYAQGARALGREVRWLRLEREAGYVAGEGALDEAFAGAALAWLAYPSNPTGAAAGAEALDAAVRAARRHGTVLLHDAAYAELRHDGSRYSALARPDAGERVVELFSLSKCFHLAGWRIGLAVARRPLLERLTRVVTLFDSGASRAAQALAEAVLREAPAFAAERRARDRDRTRRMADGLRRLGCTVAPPEAAFYVWFRPPEAALAAGLGWDAIVRDAGIACAPGEAFGPEDGDWVRFSVVVDEDVIDEVLERLTRLWEGL
jgi:LL-diaminopimelate aminotransferase